MPRRTIDQPDLFANCSTEFKQRLYDEACQLMSDNRRQLFDRLATLRTRHVAVVLEDIYQAHNASAVLRSCDCFGVQDVHVVENRNAFNPADDVAVGSSKWVDYYRHNSIAEAYAALRARGYRIVATLPHENDTMITQFDISQPTALVFGTELTGLTQEAIAGADAYVKIPMYGFTESFNISVCAALSLFSLTERMRADSNIDWQLSDDEQLALKLHWAMQTIRDGEQVITHLMNNLQAK
ncbi:MAG: RNA methyltransferase [Bacteroidales bacterium]|nr:RNA methyltransferase [Bacteroidales bacterium]